MEWAQRKAYSMPGSRGVLAAPTAADIRDVLVDGISGILNISRPDLRPKYEPSKRRLTWKNGSTAVLVSADEPDRFRGLNSHWCAVDELAAWKKLAGFDLLLLGLRLGENPQFAVATTPRPLPLIKWLISHPDVIVSRDSTHANAAHLSKSFMQQIENNYAGSRLYRQEVLGEILEDVPGALWTLDLIDRNRVEKAPDLKRIVVAIDPSTTNNEESAETGIIVTGIDDNEHGYVLEDCSLRATPAQWAKVAINAYHRWQADKIIAETNNGGMLVETVLRQIEPTIPYKSVTASRGKVTRAEPISALSEQGKIHHAGYFPQLENQLTTYVPGDKSPDRLDAFVWAMHELMISPRASMGVLGTVKIYDKLPKRNSVNW